MLPLPLTDADRDAGYWWELSMRQIETSRTIVFDAPRHARAFFEALVVDNLDIGRPDQVEVIFAGHPRRWGRPPKTEPTYKTRIDTRDTIGVTVNADYKHSRVKQYLKDGRALRIETVINYPGDLICKRRLRHLDELQAKARAVNARLLDTERVGQGCVLASPAFERVAQSTLTEDGRRSPALRFGDPRVMALLRVHESSHAGYGVAADPDVIADLRDVHAAASAQGGSLSGDVGAGRPSRSDQPLTQ